MTDHRTTHRRVESDGPLGGPPGPLRAALWTTGVATLIVQVLLLRELMTAWRGNEMSFGVALSIWLLTGGLGSAVGGAIARRCSPTRTTFALGLTALGVLAPVALLSARVVRGAMGIAAGELVGFSPLVLACVVSIVPFTLVAGSLFALGTAVLAGETRLRGSAAGRVYILEAVGAAVGGSVLSFVLLPHWGPVRIAFLVTFVASVAAVALLSAGRSRAAARRGSAWTTATLVAVVSALAVFVAADRLDELSVAAQWRELGFEAQANSVYGRIVTTRDDGQRSIYESGVLVASVPDRLSAEETVHLPMLEHPSPERVLLLGGGLGGAVAEVLKHPTVSRVDYVELDPELIRQAERSFGDAMTTGFDDPRVAVHHSDARFFVKRAGGPYDVVVVAVPDPTTAQLNRFYTAEFLREAAALLAPGGVVGLSVGSAENYIGTELAAFLAGLAMTAEAVFPSVVMLPGDPCHLVAGDATTELTRDPAALSARVGERGLDVVYVRDYYLGDRLSEERVAYFDSSVASGEGRLNADLSPAGYYLGLVLWNRQFEGLTGLLLAAPRYLTPLAASLVGLALVVALGLPALSRAAGGRTYRSTVYVAVFVVGATEISLEIAALLAFQSIYGYVYHQLALLVAAFMAGLALGGWLGSRAARRGAGRLSFALLQLAVCAVPPSLAAAVAAVAAMPPESLAVWATLFPAVVVAAALLAGIQFPIAARLLTGHGGSDASVGGRLYGADLAGAALGATACSVFLLPVMGTAGTMVALAILNLSVFVALAVHEAAHEVRAR